MQIVTARKTARFLCSASVMVSLNYAVRHYGWRVALVAWAVSFAAWLCGYLDRE